MIHGMLRGRETAFKMEASCTGLEAMVLRIILMSSLDIGSIILILEPILILEWKLDLPWERTLVYLG